MLRGHNSQSLLRRLKPKITDKGILVDPFQRTVDDQAGGLDQLMPMPHPESVKVVAGRHMPLGFAGSETHDGGPDAADTATTVGLVAVGDEMPPGVDADEGVGSVGDLEREPAVVAVVPFDHLRQQPVEVGAGPKFGSRLSGHPAVVAGDGGDVHLSEFVGQQVEGGGNLLRPMQERSEHGVIVRLGQLLMDVAREDVTTKITTTPS